MQAFSFTVNGKEDFQKAMAAVQPEWLKLRKALLDKGVSIQDVMDKDGELMDQACKNVSKKGFKVARKKLR